MTPPHYTMQPSDVVSQRGVDEADEVSLTDPRSYETITLFHLPILTSEVKRRDGVLILEGFLLELLEYITILQRLYVSLEDPLLH